MYWEKITYFQRYIKPIHLNQMSELGQRQQQSKNEGSQISDNSPEEEISIEPEPFLFFWCQKTQTGLHTHAHDVGPQQEKPWS